MKFVVITMDVKLRIIQQVPSGMPLGPLPLSEGDVAEIVESVKEEARGGNQEIVELIVSSAECVEL